MIPRWKRFNNEERNDGLWDIAPGRGRKPLYEIDKIAAIVDATRQTKPVGMARLHLRDIQIPKVPFSNPHLNFWLSRLFVTN